MGRAEGSLGRQPRSDICDLGKARGLDVSVARWVPALMRPMWLEGWQGQVPWIGVLGTLAGVWAADGVGEEPPCQGLVGPGPVTGATGVSLVGLCLSF